VRSLPVFLLVACSVTPVTLETRTQRTFRDGDPRKADYTITGHDQAGCERAFAFYSAAPPPSPKHTTACSELRYEAGVCHFYCEITGP
jgi:hypothetical protein